MIEVPTLDEALYKDNVIEELINQRNAAQNQLAVISAKLNTAVKQLGEALDQANQKITELEAATRPNKPKAVN